MTMLTDEWGELDAAAAKIMGIPHHYYKGQCWVVQWVNDVPHPLHTYDPSSNMVHASKLLDMLTMVYEDVGISLKDGEYTLRVGADKFTGRTLPFVISFAFVSLTNGGKLPEPRKIESKLHLQSAHLNPQSPPTC